MSKVPVIAIVDDDKAIREALLELLQVEGFSARIFDSASAFLADNEQTGFDCIITDVRMPEMDGLVLQRTLRTRGSAVPVIFITSSTGDEARLRALEDGAVAWFTKPVAEEALLHAVRNALAARGTTGAQGPSGT